VAGHIYYTLGAKILKNSLLVWSIQ